MGIIDVSGYLKDVENKKLGISENKEPETSEVVQPVTETDEKKAGLDPSKMVTVDGPLSNAYTEALNMLLSNEGIVNELLVGADIGLGDAVQDTDGVNQQEEGGVYVYCCDAVQLESNLTEAYDHLRVATESRKYRTLMLSMECTEMTRKTTLLNDIAGKLGMAVYFSKDSCMNGIKDLISE